MRSKPKRSEMICSEAACPVLDTVKAASLPWAWLKAVKGAPVGWLDSPADDSTAAAKALCDLTRVETHLAAGLRFVKNAAILFAPDNFKVFGRPHTIYSVGCGVSP